MRKGLGKVDWPVGSPPQLPASANTTTASANTMWQIVQTQRPPFGCPRMARGQCLHLQLHQQCRLVAQWLLLHDSLGHNLKAHRRSSTAFWLLVSWRGGCAGRRRRGCGIHGRDRHTGTPLPCPRIDTWTQEAVKRHLGVAQERCQLARHDVRQVAQRAAAAAGKHKGAEVSYALQMATSPRHDGLQSPPWVSEGRGTAPRHTLTWQGPEPAVRGHHVGCSAPTPPAASAGVGAAAKGDQVGLLQ